MYNEANHPIELPSTATRFKQFMSVKKQKMIDIVPFMMCVIAEFVYGTQIVHTH
jgi:hypothetical protein